MQNQENTHYVEFSFLYMHLRDAQTFHELAVNEKTKLKSFYARHTILSIVFALEAIINRVYDEFYLNQIKPNPFDRLSLFERWLVAPLVCGKQRPVGQVFDRSSEPFQSFHELIKIRNWIVHPKADDYIPAIKTPWTIHIEESDQEVPWVEIRPGGNWKQTNIPLNPFELTEEHSKKALDIFEKLKDKLLKAFKGVFDKHWLWEIKLKNVNQTETESVPITIDSLWGGYTPDSIAE